MKFLNLNVLEETRHLTGQMNSRWVFLHLVYYFGCFYTVEYAWVIYTIINVSGEINKPGRKVISYAWCNNKPLADYHHDSASELSLKQSSEHAYVLSALLPAFSFPNLYTSN